MTHPDTSPDSNSTGLGGSAADPRVQERVHDILHSAGQAPSQRAGSLTGSLARAQPSTPAFIAHKRPTTELHKGRITLVEPGDQEVHVVSESSSVSAKFPDAVNLRDQPHGLQMALGTLPITLTQVSDRHAFLTAAEAEGTFPRKMNQETSTSFTLTIFGQEVLVEGSRNVELPQDPESFTEEDLATLEGLIAKLPQIDPRNADYVKKVAAQAKESSDRRISMQEEEKAEIQSQSATQIQIARVKGKNPRTGATEWGIAIVPYLYGASKVYQTRIDGQPQENPQEITESGSIIFDPAITELVEATSREAHATIEIKGDGTVTVVDGDGYGRSSTHNSAVRRF